VFAVAGRIAPDTLAPVTRTGHRRGRQRVEHSWSFATNGGRRPRLRRRGSAHAAAGGRARAPGTLRFVKPTWQAPRASSTFG